jgi:nanoRNase/pAp phosphatase (c-di-AMP/oligoRNAs hydrolase)
LTSRILEGLRAALEGHVKVLIMPHNDPDPDAIASAAALQYIVTKTFGLDTHIAYRGYIGRAQNKALFEYLDYPIQSLIASQMLENSAIALIDTQPGTGNNPLPADTPASIVIDHHPLRKSLDNVKFKDIRPDAGATSTILTEYMLEIGLEPTHVLATALFYGIKTDTMGLGRGAGPNDVQAYFYLHNKIDAEALSRIEYPALPVEYFKSLSGTLRAARLYDDVLFAYLGQMSYPDLGAEMADLFLRLHGVQWILCMGVFGKDLILSVRAKSAKANAGKLVRTIVGDRGTAGGHGSMAGGHIPLRDDEPRKLARRIVARTLESLKGLTTLKPKPLV